LDKKISLLKSISNIFASSRRHIKPHNCITDRITGLPTLPSIIPELKRIVAKCPVDVLYIDIANFRSIEELHGTACCDQILRQTAHVLQDAYIPSYSNFSLWKVCSLGGDDFLVFLQPAIYSNHEYRYEETKIYLEEMMANVAKALRLEQKLSVNLGISRIIYIPGHHIESLVYNAIKEARYTAKQYIDATDFTNQAMIKQIISNQSIRVDYQSIISLKSGNILGYEALSRGPVNSGMERPEKLLKLAERYYCLLDLEMLCKKKAVENLPPLGNKLLFVNINPAILNYANFRKDLLQELFLSHGIKYENIVLELTERNRIDDYQNFRKILRFYRNLGFQIAIDDAGAGYSSLQAIAELQPEFVKIDHSLVHKVNQYPTKKAILETLMEFSYKIGARIICEGIETKDELVTLTALGCNFGQGYFISRPGTLSTELDKEIKEQIHINTHSPNYLQNLPVNLNDIIIYQNHITPNTSVEEVINVFNNNKTINGLVIGDKGIPIGLIMRERLFSILGTRYGYDLFFKRTISHIMDKNPLILPWYTPIEDAARQVAERLDQGLTDYVVVTKDNIYLGVVSVSKMLDTMAKKQIEQAKDSNPLTGLPGNKCIPRWLRHSLSSGQEFSVLYFDLNNFKAFNDYFGFEHGDLVLSTLANIIVEQTRLHGNINDLVGHIGGDDFVVITAPEKSALIANAVISVFDQKIGELYEEKIIEQGYIVAKNRHGELCKFPIMSLSIAGIHNTKNTTCKNHLEISELAAEVKKQAKNYAYSCYISIEME